MQKGTCTLIIIQFYFRTYWQHYIQNRYLIQVEKVGTKNVQIYNAVLIQILINTVKGFFKSKVQILQEALVTPT